MSEAVSTRPAICLNMIVRNEAHIVHEVLDAVASCITSWVIVDTGSDDGTQDVIRKHMAGLGIPGELHERPWRNYGHNRSEALRLAQGHGDYIWVMDADDTVMGAQRRRYQLPLTACRTPTPFAARTTAHRSSADRCPSSRPRSR